MPLVRRGERGMAGRLDQQVALVGSVGLAAGRLAEFGAGFLAWCQAEGPYCPLAPSSVVARTDALPALLELRQPDEWQKAGRLALPVAEALRAALKEAVPSLGWLAQVGALMLPLARSGAAVAALERVSALQVR